VLAECRGIPGFQKVHLDAPVLNRFFYAALRASDQAFHLSMVSAWCLFIGIVSSSVTGDYFA